MFRENHARSGEMAKDKLDGRFVCSLERAEHAREEGAREVSEQLSGLLSPRPLVDIWLIAVRLESCCHNSTL